MKTHDVIVLPLIRHGILRTVELKLAVSAFALITLNHQLSFAQQAVKCGPGKVLICHKGKNTLCVSESAVQAHLNHGDFIGACNGGGCAASSTGDRLTCKNPEISLIASPGSSSVTYYWSGPDNFSSTDNPIRVSVPGVYTVVITDLSGCIASDTAIVSQNITAPGAKCFGGTLTCDKTSVVLIGSSSASEVTYSWNGPTSSTLQNPIVTLPGTYILTVTNSANGCISTDTAMVVQDTTLPDVSASAIGILTCKNTIIKLTGRSSTSGVYYTWSGPLSFFSTGQNPVTSYPGYYTVMATNPANGCSSTANVTVQQDTSTAQVVNAIVSGILTCTTGTVTLSGSSATNGVTYHWKGPGGFTSHNREAAISKPGNYVLHVSKPSTGCVVARSVLVLSDTIQPGGVSAEVSGILTCSVQRVTLRSSSSTNGVSYNWSGSNFENTGDTASVSFPGIYALTVTNSSNGCITVRHVEVSRDTTIPAGVSASVSGKIDYANPNVVLTGSSSTINSSYYWKTPEGSEYPNNSIFAVSPGAYTFMAKNSFNDCKSSATVNVVEDKVDQTIQAP